MTGFVKVVEVGPRDGLQNEAVAVPLEVKIELFNRLSQTGLLYIEAGSFVSPRRVPQMANSDAVFSAIDRGEGITCSALVPNLAGYQMARDVGASEVALFIAASEGFSQKNTNCTIAESLERIGPILAAAKADQMPVRGYISCITHCPYDGETDPQVVTALAQKLFKAGCYEISLGDTIGKALPQHVNALLDAVLDVVPADKLAGHFHDTGGQALANVAASLARGLRVFDGAIAGLGGCPFAPGAPGNLDTLKLVRFLHEKGFETGVDLKALEDVARFVNSVIPGLR